MEFGVKSGLPEKQRTACLVVGVYEPRRLPPNIERLDKASNGYISNILKTGDLEGNVGQTLLLHNVPGVSADRVLLVGCGKERELADSQYRQIMTQLVKRLNEIGATECVCYLSEINVKTRDLHWKIRTGIEVAENTLYRFSATKSSKDTNKRPLKKFIFSTPSRKELAKGEVAVKEGAAIAAGMKLTKDLGNLPGNVCTPTYLATQAKTLAKGHKSLKVEILETADMEKLAMGSFLSVTKGSRQPPKFIVFHYNGGTKNGKPYVFVGKGITFDAGGISLKPGPGMDEMKFDMCGAAAVFGLVKTITQLSLPANIVAIVPACENLPDGNANKPGDVVTSMSGQTIEILNTDAEGRLILCDALTYAERFNPVSVIDIATLTGACVIALGRHPSGLLSNHAPLANDLVHSGKQCGDRVWEMPLWDDYQDQLKSNFADMANIGGREAGTITAACFLSRFTKKYHWAHLDIAGTAWVSGGENKGATGRPVPLLTQYLLDKTAKK